MVNLKKYFSARINKPLSWSFTAGQGMIGAAYRRDYTLLLKSVDDITLNIDVSAQDYDKDSRKISRVPLNLGTIKIKLDAQSTPLEILEDAARLSDPKYFAKHPKLKASVLSVENLDSRIQSLLSPENRAKNEGPPLQLSIDRLRAFWSKNTNLILPDLFSSADGTIRARWMDGASKTLWINFPPEGPLGWSIQIPRIGNSGLMNMRARCINDEDILPLVKILGVGCIKS